MKKTVLTALLVCWPLSVVGETNVEIKYHPPKYLESLDMHFSESYTLELATEPTNSSWAPAIKVSLQCTSQDQDYYSGIDLEVQNREDIPVKAVFGMFGPREGDYYPVRFTAPNLDISRSWEWYYFTHTVDQAPWPLSGNLNNEPAVLAQISNSLKGGWLRIEVFGFIYDFDLKDEAYMIDGFHAKCAVVQGNCTPGSGARL